MDCFQRSIFVQLVALALLHKNATLKATSEIGVMFFKGNGLKKLFIVIVSTAVTLSLYFTVHFGVELWPREYTRDEIAIQGSCDFPIEKGVVLSEIDICVINLIKERCGNLDQCFVDCYTSGKGVNIGGGCAHICNYGWKVDWKNPVGAKLCVERYGVKF